MSIRTAIVLAILVFVATLLARWPARALTPLLPAGISCDTPSGTVWHGSCAQLRSGRTTLAGFSWTLHPAALLRLHLSADLRSEDPRASGYAHVQLARGEELQISAVSAQLPLQGGLTLLPRGLTGTVQVALEQAQIRQGQLIALVGSVRVLQLRSEDQAADLGSFQLQFPPAPPGDPIQGQLRDLGGPLSVRGQLRLTRGNNYELSGSVAARDDASPQLIQALQLLGPPDAQGRRMFSLAGSL
ncbi:MAG: type II secretion system protein N [Steroidobacteraceae bacterium]